MDKIPAIFPRGDGWWVPSAQRIQCSKSSALKLTPEIIVIHWTGGTYGDIPTRTRRIRDWAADASAKASVHITIMRDGTVYQLIPTTRAAWHAGESSWRTAAGTTRKSVNYYSLSVEIDNVGPVTRKGAGYVDSYGRAFPGAVVAIGSKYYEQPPMDQLIALRMVIDALRTEYRVAIHDIVGHCDVSPGRKIDPGPCVTRQILGFADGD